MTISKKTTLIILVIALVGQSIFFINAKNNYDETNTELFWAKSELADYKTKRDECSGSMQTESYLVNTSGLSKCGYQRANSYLIVTPLDTIYYYYCSMGSGVAVYGCYVPSRHRVYACEPGTSVYDVLSSYSTRYFRHWTYLSYACSESEARNTIRHELLHTVYSNLSSAKQSSVTSKLSRYKSIYASELSQYSISERDDELFARVGADGRPINDIELIDLYSQVVNTYLSQKKSYYAELVDTTSKQVASYSNLLNNYGAMQAIGIIMIIANIIVIIFVVKKLKSGSNNDSDHEAEKTNEDSNDETAAFQDWSKKHGLDEDENKKKKPSNNESASKKKLSEEFQDFAEKHGVSNDESESEDV